MKRELFILVLLLAMAGCDSGKKNPPMPPMPAADSLVTVPPQKFVTLAWGYHDLNAIDGFKILHSPIVPVRWDATNIVGRVLSAQLPVEPGAHFFGLKAFNQNGESDFATTHE